MWRRNRQRRGGSLENLVSIRGRHIEAGKEFCQVERERLERGKDGECVVAGRTKRGEKGAFRLSHPPFPSPVFDPFVSDIDVRRPREGGGGGGRPSPCDLTSLSTSSSFLLLSFLPTFPFPIHPKNRRRRGRKRFLSMSFSCRVPIPPSLPSLPLAMEKKGVLLPPLKRTLGGFG